MTDDDTTPTGQVATDLGSENLDANNRVEHMNKHSEGKTFNAPWQARAFALAVSISEDSTYKWEDFQQRLIEEIERAGTDGYSDEQADYKIKNLSSAANRESNYYRNWLAALERLLIEDDVLTSGELRQRADAFAAGERDASEWVEDGHSHDHPHNHG
jgi:nitrile hydratase accessory protein